MSTTQAGARIRYTVGAGTAVPADPTATTGTAYSAPITVSQSKVVKAAAFDSAGNRSPITQRTYTIDTTPPPTPSVTPSTGTYATAQQMTMSTTEAGATIRFTVGAGTTVPPNPTATTGTLYTGPVTVSSSQVVKATAFDAAGNASVLRQRTYTITGP
jgi:hypothetical protein